MYVYHLFVLPVVLEDECIRLEVCMFITISSYVNHLCLNPAHVGPWNVC